MPTVFGDVVVGAALLASVLYVGRRLFGVGVAKRKADGCGGCASCGSAAEASPTARVEIRIPLSKIGRR